MIGGRVFFGGPLSSAEHPRTRLPGEPCPGVFLTYDKHTPHGAHRDETLPTNM